MCLSDSELRYLIVHCRLRRAQAGICFASAWSKYVQQFGSFVRLNFSRFLHW